MNGNVIIFVVFAVMLFGIGIYVYKKEEKKKENVKEITGSQDTIDVIEDILGPMCYGNAKPKIKCDNNQDLLCDKKLRDWRCRLNCEDEENNPFPYDFKNCGSGEDVKCDDSGNFYCNNKYCKNDGILYANSNGKCSCKKYYRGDRCDILINKCGLDGQEDPKDPTKCTTCCNVENLVGEGDSKNCRYYGSQCDYDCESSIINSVYKNNICECPWGVQSTIKKNGKNVCFVPEDKCDPTGTEKIQTTSGLKNTIVSNITDSRYGLCKCKPGFIGQTCNIKICGDGGEWKVDNTGVGRCVCKTDELGNPLFFGEKCQYNKSYCNDRATSISVNANDIIKCVCDPKYDGDKCQCTLSERPEEDKCRGIISKCSDDGTWKNVSTTCKDIYKNFGDEITGRPGWQKSCSPILLSADQISKGYEVGCIDDSSEPGGKRFISLPSCNGKPTDEMLKKCRETPNCYNPYDYSEPDGTATKFQRDKVSEIPQGFNKVCQCDTLQSGIPSYTCKDITDSKTCGPIPPIGFCKKGGKFIDPYCLAPKGTAFGPRAWVCPGAIIPSEIAKTLYNVKDNQTGLNINSKWYNTTGVSEYTTVYPTIDMEKCIKLMDNFQTAPRPYSQLESNTVAETEPAWMSLQSEAGYVDNLKDNPVFYDMDSIKTERDKYIRFNNRLTDNTKVVNKITGQELTLSQFMDLYTKGTTEQDITDKDSTGKILNRGDKNVLDNKNYKLVNANPGLTNLDTENKYVVKPYNIYCATPINK